MTSPDLVIQNATVVTMDPERRILPGAAIEIRDGRIAAIPESGRVEAGSARVIDGTGRIAIPGFVNAHTHCVHNLLRGGLSDDRVLYDWLINVLSPGVIAYTRSDAEVASRLFCVEAIRSGITTFVDNADSARVPGIAEVSLGIFMEMGLRAIYARMFTDITPPALEPYLELLETKEPEVRHDREPLEQASEALAHTEQLMRRFHGTADGRVQVWPSPGVAVFCSKEALLGAKDLARRMGTMVTIHVAESPHDAVQDGVSAIEYLASIGFLGPEILAGHCVQVNHNDIRMLKAFDVKVSNNAVSNMFLASGIAPVGEMLAAGITVGIGTDDPNCNTSVNMLSDMKFVALAQKVRYRASAAMTAERVLEMATIDGARAVGMQDEIGSIEVGKKADVVLVDARRPNMVPCHSIPSTLVYQAGGSEVETVLVDGRILMENGVVTGLSSEQEQDLLVKAQAASEAVSERAGLEKMRLRGWRSVAPV